MHPAYSEFVDNDLVGERVVDKNDLDVATIRALRPNPENPFDPYVLVEWESNGDFGTYQLSRFRSEDGHLSQMEREMDEELLKEEICDCTGHHKTERLPWWKRLWRFIKS